MLFFKLDAMEPIKASVSLLLLLIQVNIVMSSKMSVVTASEGQSVAFTCAYPPVHRNNSKFFCRAKPVCHSHLIRTRPREQWVTNGSLSLFDNLTVGQFVVNMDRLRPEDSDTYWCGVKIPDDPDCINVVQLYVTQIRRNASSNPSIMVDKHNLPLFMTVVSCLSALLIVFLVTLCLVFTVRKRKRTCKRARPREMSSDYVVMKSVVSPDLKLSTIALKDPADVNVPARTRSWI